MSCGSPPNPDLYNLAKAYVRAAMDLLAKLVPKKERERFAGFQEWKRSSGDFFALRPIELPYWNKAWQHAEVLHRLPEYEAFVEAMRRDVAVVQHLDVLVGTNRGGQALRTDVVANVLIWKMADSKNGLVFDSDEFDRLYKTFDADLRSDDFEFTAVAPIAGLKSVLVPIRLEADLEIDRLTDEEIERCLAVNVSSLGPNWYGEVHLAYPFSVKYQFSEKKKLGESVADVAQLQKEQEETTAKILDVSHALRLFKPGKISVPSVVMFTHNWLLEGRTSGAAIEQLSAAGLYELSEKDVSGFQAFWDSLKRARRTAFLDAAIRRFGYAGERQRPEDRLVDLMICAESLFLSDAGQPKERGEMRYRLSLRFAFFAELRDYGRIDAFRLMRSAYDARSQIVHGATLDEDALKLPNIGRVPLTQFVEVVEEALRAVLHKAIKVVVDSDGLLDWETLILQGVLSKGDDHGYGTGTK